MPNKPHLDQQSVQDWDWAESEIDHRLIRRATIKSFRSGVVGRDTICDAHRELMRVARNFGRATRVKCPICVEHNLVTVTYLFGPRLARHGKLITTKNELEQYARRTEQFTSYLIEVCRGCSWHHLLKSRKIGAQTK